MEEDLNVTELLAIHQPQTSPTPTDIVEVGFPYERPERDEILREKILTILAGNRDYPPGWSPGKWTWSAVRRKVGGRVRSGHFRKLVDDLLADGLIVEVFEAASGWGWRQHRHLLVRSDRIDAVAWDRLVTVRGREDVLEPLAPLVREPTGHRPVAWSPAAR